MKIKNVLNKAACAAEFYLSGFLLRFLTLIAFFKLPDVFVTQHFPHCVAERRDPLALACGARNRLWISGWKGESAAGSRPPLIRSPSCSCIVPVGASAGGS